MEEKKDSVLVAVQNVLKDGKEKPLGIFKGKVLGIPHGRNRNKGNAHLDRRLPSVSALTKGRMISSELCHVASGSFNCQAFLYGLLVPQGPNYVFYLPPLCTLFSISIPDPRFAVPRFGAGGFHLGRYPSHV